MDNISIAKLKKQSVIIFPDIAQLFEVYSKAIRPQIVASGNLLIHQKISLGKPTLYIGVDKKLQLVNNFEIFYLLKTFDIEEQLLSQNLLIAPISEEKFRVSHVFYELIDIIAKYERKLDLELVFKALKEFLTIDMNKQMFDKNVFAAATFCKLINVQEQTYYNRCKGRVKNAES